MDINRLALTHFRNFETVDSLELPRGALLVAAAPNATGKTNLLESIVWLLRGRSWRGGADECVQWGHDSFIIRGEVTSQRGEVHRLGLRYHKPTRKMRVEENGVVASAVTFYTAYPLLLFLPDDTFLLSRGPEVRRTFMNQVLSSSPRYLAALVQYYRALRQRNAALKRAQSSADVAAWTTLLASHAEAVWQQRLALVQFLQQRLSDLYVRFSGEKHEFGVRLQHEGTAERLKEQLDGLFAKEQRYGYTLLGPHRDDMEISTAHGLAVGELSRGQLRSLVIALKLAAAEWLEHVGGEKPILLLDDILSELDEARQQILLEQLPATQTLLTCTTIPSSVRQRSNAHLLDIGTIIRGDRSRLPVVKTRAEVEPEKQPA